MPRPSSGRRWATPVATSNHSLDLLLRSRRPAVSGRRIETLNDADGWLVNTWRAIRWAPDEVAHHAAWPISEIDYHARLAWLQERRDDRLVSWLEGDPEVFDAKAAGWWLYVVGLRDWRPVGRGAVACRGRASGEGRRGPGRVSESTSPRPRAMGVHRGHDTTGTHEEQVRAYMRTLAARLSASGSRAGRGNES